MSRRRVALGQWGEEMAASFLISKGYDILGRNIRTSYGEIDLIASKDQQLVFVEVKTRTSTQFGNPEDAVNDEKRAHMLASAQAYLQENPATELDWRIDVIAITKLSQNQPEIIHFENVIT